MQNASSDREVSGKYFKDCRAIRGCPASLYLNCEVHARGLNCWETEEGCMDCDGHCEECEVLRKARELGLVAGT
ncbi:MAG TPA: hypothetical protein GXX51_08150 [Firmicutes bacterium]|nr:hypothetical protein [Bacillota bacterium]